MSVEQNRKLVRRLVEQGINPANMDVLDELVAEDVVDHYAPPGSPPGREGWKQNRLMFKAAFPDGHWEILDMVAEGNLVATRASFSGTHQGSFFGTPATGRHVANGAMFICRVVEGQVVERWGNSDDVGMLRQLGAIPSGQPVDV